VIYDYFHDFAGGSLFAYSDLLKPASLFQEKNGKLVNLLDISSNDSMPVPVIFHNKAGMVNFVYRSKGHEKSWVVWLHGGPSGQMSMRFNIYLLQLIDAGWNVIVLNYPGSTGVGNQYEYSELSRSGLLNVQLKTIREDILSIKSKFPSLHSYSFIGLSHGTIAAHAYASVYKDEVDKLVDFSGVAVYSGITSGIPTLYIYGEYDFSIRRPARVKLIEEDLARGNGHRMVLKQEGHIINHARNISTITDAINRFLD
jgi:pimeloyl-ACP methyl ester carboxylesterase